MTLCEGAMAACGALAAAIGILFRALNESRRQHIEDLRDAAQQHAEMRVELEHRLAAQRTESPAR